MDVARNVTSEESCSPGASSSDPEGAIAASEHDLCISNEEETCFDEGSTDALIAACCSGQADLLRQLMERQADNVMLPEVCFAGLVAGLIVACKEGHGDCVRQLLSSSLSTRLLQREGLTAVLIAIRERRTDCLQCLLVHGADVNQVSPGGTSALMTATREGYVDGVELLLAHHARVELARQNGLTPLHIAAKLGHAEVLQLLLSAPEVDANLTSDSGATALMAACQEGQAGCVRMLLEGGAQVGFARKNGWTALMEACFAGHLECVELLLDAHADASQASPSGTTALMAATQAGHSTCVEALLMAGAEVDATRENGWTALMAACQAGHTACAELLLEYGASLDLVTSDGVTALIVACSQGWSEMCQLLSYSGATRTCTRSGLTPTDVATHFGHDEIAAFLRISADWFTPLHYFGLLPPAKTLDLLRDGADIHARVRPDAVSPLDVARQLALGGQAAEGSSAAMVLTAAAPWSPTNHHLFPHQVRSQAAALLEVGQLLARQPRFAGESGALVDVWIEHIMPHAVTRSVEADYSDVTLMSTKTKEPTSKEKMGESSRRLKRAYRRC